MAIYFPFLTLISWLVTLVHPASARSCWRKTTCTGAEGPAFPGDWDANNFAPESRNVAPVAVYDLSSGQEIATWPSTFAINSSNQTDDVYLDFGKEVGGIVTIEYTVSSVSEDGALGLAFSEAKNWVGRNSDSSNGNYARPDGAIYDAIASEGNFTYAMPLENLRGGFRYLTLFLLGEDTSVDVTDVRLELAFQPTWSDLRAYQGYFHSSDDMLNKIWYSGAYTLQLNAVPPTTGRAWPSPDTAWQNTGVLGPGDTINVDGAKRDRTVWPGDMGVAAPASFYSTGDLESLKNSLQTLYDNQAESGLLPFAGPPLFASGSDTYHLWTMIGLYNYILYSNDLDFLRTYWQGYTRAMDFILSQMDENVGLVNISAYAQDWGRFDSTGYLASAQMLTYHALTTGATLATWINETTSTKDWLQIANDLQTATISKLWDSSTGAFRDNHAPYDKNLHPQDGNSLALITGLVKGTSKKGQAISTFLTTNWTPDNLGPESPELPGEISPFITSFEIQAHLLAHQPRRALDVMRKSWGWYLFNENGTQSTMIEGYLTDGTFGYRHDAGYQEDYSYTSHAHGWSTGPVTALSAHVLGLGVSGLGGRRCAFAPQLGDLDSVQGGFVTGLGKYSASVRFEMGCRRADIVVPEDVMVDITLPSDGCRAGNASLSSSPVLVDGRDDVVVRVVDGPGGTKLFTLELTGGGEHTIVY
ncbi:glycoside hydrolase family 78 protein [Poronia punctata]|nr:glycoside hydrolase family 78 protein [Poronia punctata]